MVSLVLPAFDDTCSLGSPPRKVVYHASVSTVVTESLFLEGNREAKLKPTTYLLLLLFRVYLSLLFSENLNDIVL